jgi:hypothetical protein
MLEADEGTAWLRVNLSDIDERWRLERARESGTDMLTARVPEAGLTVGLSREVYGACSSMRTGLRQIVAEAAWENGYPIRPDESTMGKPHDGGRVVPLRG